MGTTPSLRIPRSVLRSKVDVSNVVSTPLSTQYVCYAFSFILTNVESTTLGYLVSSGQLFRVDTCDRRFHKGFVVKLAYR
jgi:hypothetical protein